MSINQQKNDPYASLRIKEFNLFLLVRFALVFGWSMQFIIIEWQVYSITKNPLSLGIIGLMEVIPAVSMALFAGHIVDQKEKRNLLALCIGIFSLISLGLFFLTLPSFVADWQQNTILYAIYGLVFFGGLLRSFFGPTIFSLIGLIVPKKLYPNAATWSSSTWQMASVLGPAFAGFTISWIGVHWSLCIVFSLVLFSFLMVFFISKKPILNPKIGEPILKSLQEGIHFVFKTKAILGAITLDMISVLFGGAVALLPIYAQDILKVGPEGFGALRAAPAIGAFLTMLVTAYIPISKNAGLKLLAAIFGFGTCIIVFGLSSIFWISIVALFFSGVTDGVSMVIRQTILQLKTPDHMRGRVASVNSMFVGSSNELGAFESGVTAKLMGTVTAVIFGGTMTLITVITTGILNPTLRKLDLTKDLEAHQKME
ncbi:MFS transporter [Tenacibaculum finnmarkense genomovar finnmarkense]|uniref:MFS transporter n=1 Tax=Tenacibaculum finnmarkense TaxID=2781243 RepID=UPI001E2B9700|nr:MFS transporter [Tenacibaculum finnmarkense]MCD8417022.1 MFS transporter [Tenacibaculum finnmarkense genomovar finnmarkense]MCG8184585.1 MFS transporter [Tenacibaculum finnmarkense genomovar finnmarkense]MCG8201955.1 MFS transporter [Tenacibaculum finnmarkense genomovar finnmarkense]MCG8208709.1 MFS transporter [Tenacibaculum finnmarkense genomovar finnmarkense]MCG8211440.1 MFS transporter [Tenacibaculum finnmarkense genomovar finnmarkense]